MNENPQINRTSLGAGLSIATGFVLGAVVGAGIALLLAPETGKETRRRLADAGGRLSDAARSKFDQARDTANDLKHNAKSALDGALHAFEAGQKPREPRADSRTEQKG